MGMQVRVTNPDLQAKVETRHMLDSRHDDIRCGKVKLIPGDEVEAELRQRIAERRSLYS